MSKNLPEVEKEGKLLSNIAKNDTIERISDLIKKRGFKIIDSDISRPWGAFFVIDEKQTNRFIDTFFEELSVDYFKGFKKLSPKILIVEPYKRLSWQFHNRRSEIWKVVEGNAGVVLSPDNELKPIKWHKAGELIEISNNMRHRLIGGSKFVVIAEIWKHTDIDNPSDENDIIRVEDDFGR